MKWYKRIGWVVLVLLVASASTVSSRSESRADSSAVKPRRLLSYSPRPLPECRYFFITEFGVVYRCDRPPRAEAGVWTTFLAEAGFMGNVTYRTAVGGTIFGEGGGDGSRGGIRGRCRLWLQPRSSGSSRASLDISPGVILWGSHKYAWPLISGPNDPDLPDARLYSTRYPGFVTSVTLNLREYVGIMLHAEYIPLDQVGPPPLSERRPSRTHDTAFYAGLRSGSYGGPMMWVSVAVTAAVLASVFGR